MKLLSFVVAAVFVGLGIILSLAVAHSATTQQTVKGTSHSAELMRLYERNRRFDVDGLGCVTLPDFDLKCTLARSRMRSVSGPPTGPS